MYVVNMQQFIQNILYFWAFSRQTEDMFRLMREDVHQTVELITPGPWMRSSWFWVMVFLIIKGKHSLLILFYDNSDSRVLSI